MYVYMYVYMYIVIVRGFFLLQMFFLLSEEEERGRSDKRFLCFFSQRKCFFLLILSLYSLISHFRYCFLRNLQYARLLFYVVFLTDSSEECISSLSLSLSLYLSGVVYTCGLNDAHQLGQTPKSPDSPILPFSLSPYYLRSLKGKPMIAVGAGRYHTAVCMKNEIYTCGKNLGQLGYERTSETQMQPKKVRWMLTI